MWSSIDCLVAELKASNQTGKYRHEGENLTIARSLMPLHLTTCRQCTVKTGNRSSTERKRKPERIRQAKINPKLRKPNTEER